MEEATATALAQLLVRQNNEQLEFLRSVETDQPSDFLEVRSLLAKTLGESYLEILKPIFERHPHIKPSNYP